jgi:hypothetical protein
MIVPLSVAEVKADQTSPLLARLIRSTRSFNLRCFNKVTAFAMPAPPLVKNPSTSH